MPIAGARRFRVEGARTHSGHWRRPPSHRTHRRTGDTHAPRLDPVLDRRHGLARLVREHGRALFGPPPATLIDPIAPDVVRRATIDVLRSWWGTADAVSYIRAAPPGGLSFIALTMCRALYALERGEVVSKPVAADWALRTQDARWRPLIERSLRWELTDDVKKEMIAFVRYVTTKKE